MSDASELESIFSSFSNAILASYTDSHEQSALINISSFRQSTHGLASFFKLSSIFSCDSAIEGLAIDSIQNELRFSVKYILQSSINNFSISLNLKTADGFAVISLQDIYPGFNWVERESFDLCGIFFIKHPDLRRILTDYGFSGHPLRKDFPVSGFSEVHYNDSAKSVSSRNVELSQSLRVPNLLPVWVEHFNEWENERS